MKLNEDKCEAIIIKKPAEKITNNEGEIYFKNGKKSKTSTKQNT